MRWVGTPNLPIQCLMRASLQAVMSMLVRGTASSILLALLMMVKRYWYPSLDTGRGPTMSKWMWENGC